MRDNIRFLAVDLQGDFTRPDGAFYANRPSVDFIHRTLVPFLRESSIRTLEIVSDYRGPRKGDDRDICRPGEIGYESDIPVDIKVADIWIKSMNSPIWVRENIGDPDLPPGEPYPDPSAFERWLKNNAAEPENTTIVLYGLTLDCCVLCTAQELSFRGYEVYVLEEGTDTRSGDREEKRYLLSNPPLQFWAKSIRWDDLKEHLSASR